MTTDTQHTDPGRAFEPSGPSVQVPVVDLAALEGADESATSARARLLEIARNPGSFYLTGHGIPIEIGDDLFAAARTFFDLPESRKLEIENVHSPQFRGYTKVGGELTAGKVDRREQIDIGPERAAVPVEAGKLAWARLIGPNLWPQDVPELRVRALAWYDEVSVIGRRLLRALSLALGQPETAFDGVFATGSDSLLKIVRYPGRGNEAESQGVGPHTDSGLLTFVWQEPGTSGLQTLVGADWVEVPVLPGSFAVNIGELLEVATDGVLHANVHQVISPESDADRRSICFFLNPELSVRVPILRYEEALRELATGPRSVPTNPFHATYGQNALKSRLRSHPNVAQRHHADLLTEADLLTAKD